MRKILAWVLVILWCIVIFYFSAEDRNESHQRSKIVTQGIENAIVKVLDPESLDIKLNRSTEYYVRKTSHVLVYFILTILVYNAVVFSKIKGYKRYGLAFLVPFIYAIIDELHQAYVPGRGPMVKDVFIDSVGILLGLFFCHTFISNLKIIRKLYSK